jgi:hypothetical protein
VKRTRQHSDGLRELLIAEQERSLKRWAMPGKPDERLEDLRAHVPVVVSSAQLLHALSRAGLPCDRFAYGGADWRKTFVLDAHDELREAK